MKTFFLASLLVIGTAITSFPQNVPILYKEFTEKESTARNMLPGRVFRSTSETETSSGRTKFILEIASTTRKRYVSITTSPKGETKTSETIWIGETGWNRIDDGPWKELKPGSGQGSGSGSGSGGRIVERIERNTRENGIMLNNERADLYENRITTKIAIGEITKTTVRIQRNWFNREGLLLKDEYVTENDDKVTYKYSTSYEYPAVITIERPTVVQDPEPKN